MKNLIIISAPSGSGKTTLCRALQKHDPSIRFSVSYTTRDKRHYEQEGFDYFFISEGEFRKLIDNNKLIEYEIVHGDLYGTSIQTLEDTIKNNEQLLLEVDVKGAMSIKGKYPEESITVFIMPPSVEDLKNRLRRRGSDSEERIHKRLERLKIELSYRDRFDFIVINDNLGRATRELMQIINRQKKGVLHGT